MHKKAQGLSVNTIIIAAIALIVLVVLIAVFTGRFGIFSKSLGSCETNGGQCLPECKLPNVEMTQYDCPSGFSQSGESMVISAGKTVCCVKLKK